MSKTMETIIKEKEYQKYIKEHRDLVKKAFEKFFDDGKVITAVYNQADNEILLAMCRSFIIDHDKSKFSDEEFDIYRKHFYPVNEEERESVKDDLEKAYKHHYENNPHHPEYWNPDKDNITKSMPVRYLIEMCCDLIAVSAQKGGNPGDWWEDNKNSKPMIDADKKEMSDLFGAIYRIYGTYDLK